MSISSRRFFAACVLAFTVLDHARADWPIARHDAKRTATSATPPSLITRPAPFWRYYLGGSLNPRGYLADDVNGDGKVEVVYVAGGKVIAKLPDDTLVWESAPLEIQTLVGIDDLDGDGKKDVVGFSSGQAFVLSGMTGQIEWEETRGEMGTVGSVRHGDLDGDGHPDLFVDECGCCGVASGSPGVAYRFAGGFGNVKPMWTSPAHPHCGAGGDTLGDFDGDGKLDLGYSSYANAQMVRGRDGMALGTSAPTGTRVDSAVCDAVDVDGRPGDEMICYQDIFQASGNVGGRQVFVVTYDANANPPVVLLWKHATTDVSTGRLVRAGASVSDLDGDGKKEVVVSDFDGGKWTLRVYDAATGAEVGKLGGSVLATVVDVNGDGVPEILATVGGDLHAYQFKRGATPAIGEFWSIAGGLAPLAQVDWKKARRSGNDSRALALDLDGDGALDPIVLSPAAMMNPAALLALKAKVKGVPPTTLASFPVPDGVALLAYQTFPSVNRNYEQLLVTRNDGFLVILDNALLPTNAVMQGEFPLPGMRVGGYYSGSYGPGPVPIAPSVTEQGKTADVVIARDSRGALLRLDPKSASLIEPPQLAWQIAGAWGASAVAGLDAGKTAIACNLGGKLQTVRLDGTPIWSAPLPASPLQESLPGDANKDGVPDLFTASVDGGSTAFFQVFDGKTGAPLWKSPVSEALMWGFTPFSVADWDGDGAADLVAVLNTLRVHSGQNGALVASNPSFLAYFMPVLADVDGDGKDEVTLTGGYFPARTFAHDLTTTLWTGQDDRPYPFGARAACTANGVTRSIWVQSGLATSGQLRLVTMAGAQAGQATTMFLAGGAVYGDAAAAEAAGKRLGTIGNVTIKAGLADASRPSALVGSTDGFLYAINPCATTIASALDWSYDLRFSVGEAIFADTSGDGIDEVLVTAADGYLYDFAQQIVAAPDFVWDIEAPPGITDHDVDTIATHDALYAKWGIVPAADAYEVAVLTAGGSYVTQPNWQNVGKVTQTEVDGLPLVEGKRYFFAVRAIANGKGASTEAISNGVTVHLVDRPDMARAFGMDDLGLVTGEMGASSPRLATGCSCEIAHAPPSRSAPLVAFALLALAFVKRKRSRRSTVAPTGTRPDRH